jgi:hypothetical protein
MANWLPRTQVPGQRLSVIATTMPLLPGASALLDLPGLGRLGHFLAVSTDAPGWVSFYSSAAAREVDGSRPITQDPAPGSGVLLDLVTTAAALTITAPPGGTYFSTETVEDVGAQQRHRPGRHRPQRHRRRAGAMRTDT